MDKVTKDYEALCELEELGDTLIENVNLVQTWLRQCPIVDEAYYRSIANHKADRGVKELFLGIDLRK